MVWQSVAEYMYFCIKDVLKLIQGWHLKWDILLKELISSSHQTILYIWFCIVWNYTPQFGMLIWLSFGSLATRKFNWSGIEIRYSLYYTMRVLSFKSVCEHHFLKYLKSKICAVISFRTQFPFIYESSTYFAYLIC